MRTFIFLATLFLGITTPLFASAATIQINPNLPGVEGATDLVSIVVNIYQTALLVGAFLAFGSIVYGAVTYALAEAGFAKSEARERITNAIIGLLLLAAAYLLLYTINPALTILTNPGLEEVAVIKNSPIPSGGIKSGGGGGGGTSKDIKDAPPNNTACFKQGDPRWGPKTYGPDSSYTSYAEAGCGPTSLAIVIKTLTGQDVTPDSIGTQIVQKGWRVKGNGTSHAAMTGIPQLYNLKSTNIGSDLNAAKQCTQSGGLVISSVHGGGQCNQFTSEGHFIVITGSDSNGNVMFNDPGPRSNSCYRQTTETFIKACINSLWCVQK